MAAGERQPIFIDAGNISDSATLTASSESGELVAENIQDPRINRVWRTTNDTSETMDFDFGAVENVNCIVFATGNLTNGATVTVDASTTGTFGGEEVEILAAVNVFESIWGYGEGGYGEHGYGGFRLDAEFTGWAPIFYADWSDEAYRYWRVTLTDPDNSDGYIELGRMALETNFRPERSYAWGAQLSLMDASIVGRTRGQNFYSSAVNKTQRLSLRFPAVQSDTWHHDWAPFVNSVGRTRSFFFLMDERDSPDTWHSVARWYVRFSDLPVYDESFYGAVSMTLEQAH